MFNGLPGFIRSHIRHDSTVFWSIDEVYKPELLCTAFLVL